MLENDNVAQEMINLGQSKKESELKTPLKINENLNNDFDSNMNEIKELYDDEDTCFTKIWMFFIVFLVNLILPGVGTMIIGWCKKRGRAFFVLLGLAQFLLALLVIGWIWAFLTSFELLWKNDSRPYPKKNKRLSK